MRVFGWVLIWLVILCLAGWVIWRRLRGLRDRAVELSEQLAEAESLGYAVRLAAEERLREQERAELTDEPGTRSAKVGRRHTLAVFDDASALARERDDLRQALALERQARRAAALPGWARTVDSQATPSDRKAVNP